MSVTIQLILRVGLRLVVLICLVYAAAQLTHMVRAWFNDTIMPGNQAAVHRAIVLGTLAYILLTALPFVPGAEIGLAMLALLGPAIAPVVYMATIISLTLAFIIGRLIPPRLTARALARLGLRRAAALITEIAASPPPERLGLLVSQIDHGAMRLATRYRYVLLALLINMPGNVIIGGGGGIAMVAGLSRVFAPLPFLATIAIAVLPVPLAVFFMLG
ncbi:MAG: hypothetical protein WD046_01325 [Paracoccaceae bacterium]